VPITHAYSATGADSGDARISSSEWNAAHNSPEWQMLFNSSGAGGQQPFTNMPAALTDLASSTANRVPMDLTRCNQVALFASVDVIGNAGAQFRAQYSTDSGANWNYFDGGTGPSVAVDSLGFKDSGLVTMVAGAKADVLVRVAGIGGNGVLDPTFGIVGLRFR
jgi:hypothetical protein